MNNINNNIQLISNNIEVLGSTSNNNNNEPVHEIEKILSFDYKLYNGIKQFVYKIK